MCICVRDVKGKRLELSTPNLIHIYSVTVAWHTFTADQNVRSQGLTFTKTVMDTRLILESGHVLGLFATAASMGLHGV